MQIIATSPELMATARLGQMVTLSPRRLAEQPLRGRSVTASASVPRPPWQLGRNLKGPGNLN